MEMRTHDTAHTQAVEAAAAFLSGKGYAVLEKHWKCGADQVDVIAQSADTMVFVKVDEYGPDSCFGFTDCPDEDDSERYSQVAQRYMACRGRWAESRLDRVLVFVDGDRTRVVEHRKGFQNSDF